jgi:hypothetical protein
MPPKKDYTRVQSFDHSVAYEDGMITVKELYTEKTYKVRAVHVRENGVDKLHTRGIENQELAPALIRCVILTLLPHTRLSMARPQSGFLYLKGRDDFTELYIHV